MTTIEKYRDQLATIAQLEILLDLIDQGETHETKESLDLHFLHEGKPFSEETAVTVTLVGNVLGHDREVAYHKRGALSSSIVFYLLDAVQFLKRDLIVEAIRRARQEGARLAPIVTEEAIEALTLARRTIIEEGSR